MLYLFLSISFFNAISAAARHSVCLEWPLEIKSVTQEFHSMRNADRVAQSKKEFHSRA